MRNQFDLEQDIMSCWNVTSDLDVLFEELVENNEFTKDQASNFVLGLSTIYQSKFDKLFRTFESFLRTYYRAKQQVEQYEEDLAHMRAELKEYHEEEYARKMEYDEDEYRLVEDENSFYRFRNDPDEVEEEAPF